MLKLQKQLAAAKTSNEKTAIKRQIDATDKLIDQSVYEPPRLFRRVCYVSPATMTGAS